MESCQAPLLFRELSDSSDHQILAHESRLTFQPFAVQCLTCGSQLRVTDPTVVGTIASCPKCSSMVQIDRPGGQVAVGQSTVDSQAITEEAISAGDGSTFEANTEAQGFSGSDAVTTPQVIPEAMPPNWQSEKTRRSRQIASVIALSATGLLLAAAVFGWFVHSWRKKDTQQTVNDQVVTNESNSSLDSMAHVTVEDAVGKDAVDNATGRELADDDEMAVDGATDASSVGEKLSGEADRPHENDPIDRNESGLIANKTSDELDRDDPMSKPLDSSIPADLLGNPVLSPLPTDPTDALNVAAQNPEAVNPDVSSIEPTNRESPETGEQDVGSMQELPPELEKYTKFLLGDVAQQTPTLEAPPTMEAIKVDAAAQEPEEGPLLPTQPKAINFNADLAIRLALDSDGYPFNDLMLLVSQVSGVPIQVDWVSFDLAGVDVETKVPTVKAWRSARQILDGAASKLGAELREEESLLILTLTDANFDDTINNVTNLDDFGDGSESAKQVLTAFLAGDTVGDVRQSKQLSALATDVLRRMRQIAPKVADDRISRWACASNDPESDWAVLTGGDSGPQVDSPIAIAGFLRRIARLNQATCLFNWYDANRRGATPERLVLPHAGPDAGSTIEGVLKTYGLQVRQTDAGHWWVGSEATYDRLPILVWTPPLGDARDLFVQRIEKIMAGASSNVFRLAIDEESDRALLLLPRYIVRQLPTIAPSIARK